MIFITAVLLASATPQDKIKAFNDFVDERVRICSIIIADRLRAQREGRKSDALSQVIEQNKLSPQNTVDLAIQCAMFEQGIELGIEIAKPDSTPVNLEK